MENAGFIKISRSILKSAIWKDGYDAALYCFFLLRASHNYYGKLKPGQFYSSITSISKALGWSRNNTAKHIASLKDKGFIMVSHEGGGTIFTIIGWSEICMERSQMAAENSTAHFMGWGAQDLSGDAQDLSSACPRFEHNQKQYNQEQPRTITYREQAFEVFWESYPRHEEKSAARKLWMEMRNVSPEKLIAALEAAKASRDWLKEGGRYIPRAAKWLDGKWEDYVIEKEAQSEWAEY